MIVPVWADGRITIPAVVRRKLGIKPGSVVRTKVGENEFIIRPMECVSDQSEFGSRSWSESGPPKG